jgi:uncharacterized Zn finger protein (UPF0148 family)
MKTQNDFTCPKCGRLLPLLFQAGETICIECKNADLRKPQQPSLEEVPRKRRPNIHDD